MISIRKFTLACIVAAAAALPLTAQAQGPASQDTYFTFSGPVELPGTTLPAGRYLFTLADSQSNRHIVRVMSDDRRKIYTTAMTIPSYSLGRPPSDPEIRFMEGPETGPQAVKIWIYPGRTVGHEFLYPRSQAARLARASGEPVLTTKTEMPVTETVADADMTRIDREGIDAAMSAETRALEPDPDAQRGTRTAAEASQSPTRDPALNGDPAPSRADRTELPSTFTLLPLAGLIGLGSLAAGLMLRRSRS